MPISKRHMSRCPLPDCRSCHLCEQLERLRVMGPVYSSARGKRRLIATLMRRPSRARCLATWMPPMCLGVWAAVLLTRLVSFFVLHCVGIPPRGYPPALPPLLSHSMINPRRLNTALSLYTMLHSVHIGMQFVFFNGLRGSQCPLSNVVMMCAFL